MEDGKFAQINQFLLVLYQDARQLAPYAFQQRMLEHLAEFVDYDYAVWGGAREAEREVTDLVTINQSPELLIQWQEVAHQDRFCDLTLNHLNHTWMFDDIADYRNSLAYNEHWRAFDIQHMISTIMSEPVDGYVSYIGLCNTDHARPFSEVERHIKQFLMPHLSEALRINRQMALHIPGDEEEGMALVNHKGMILASRPPFDQLLREEWGHEKFSLPTTIFSEDNAFGDWCGESIRLQYRQLNGHYLVRGRPVSSLDKLPSRAREAAELYATGFSHKEVARRMGISPETVRKHLARTFTQLGINNKASLARIVSQGQKNSFWIPPNKRSPDMPYSSPSQLPDSVSNNLPKHAQEIYMAAFNNAWDEYKNKQERRGDADREEVAHKVAWSAVKQQYEKREGKWRKKE